MLPAMVPSEEASTMGLGKRLSKNERERHAIRRSNRRLASHVDKLCDPVKSCVRSSQMCTRDERREFIKKLRLKPGKSTVRLSSDTSNKERLVISVDKKNGVLGVKEINYPVSPRGVIVIRR